MGAEPLTQEDIDFLAYYGKTMASVQEFEHAMVRLARLMLPKLSKNVPFLKGCSIQKILRNCWSGYPW